MIRSDDGLILETEVSRIDCRLFSSNSMKHYFTMDRVDEHTVMIVGVTFPITRNLMNNLLFVCKFYGFKFIKYERSDRVITYDIINRKFIGIEKSDD